MRSIYRRLFFGIALIAFSLIGIGLAGSTTFADTVYTVQSGDTLFSIARRFNVSVQELIETNNIINPNFIFVNQQLVIPGDDPAEPSSETFPYTVQSGDTLLRIAVKFQTSVTEIAALNRLSNINFIFVGQQLLIPGSNPVSTAVPPTATVTVPAIFPTDTPAPTQPAPAATAIPTQTPVPTATPEPTAAPITGSPAGSNLLPNPSFENGHYNQGGVAELQMPNGWRLEWDEGNTGFGDNVWDVWRRPETRVLSTSFLPASEHGLFIFDGTHTVKIFKGNGPISARVLTEITLEPGTYELEAQVFPDLVVAYENGTKVYAPDPLSGEVRLIGGGADSGWMFPSFGQKNIMTYRFTISETQTTTVGVALRGRFAISNNGWFVDNWSLRRVE